MFFTPPIHKNNIFDVLIKGNFRDSKDSFYSFSEKDFVHITFVKREDKTIWEEVRSLMMIDSIDEFFPNAEPDLIYRSNYNSVRGYRAFLNRQPLFEEHEPFLKKYGNLMYIKPVHGFSGFDDSLPF
jgi:hypothetical protein